MAANLASVAYIAGEARQELLDTLGKKLVAHNYDFRHLVKDICTSLASCAVIAGAMPL